ncbi:uncharacterized protein BDV17DRAFT_264637 [Aspergillus undulatus]|uniref:uncharacterized protein n=1 Tax=Aspergillus undulatus TaxID=1810928 RepID=UPI003CCD7CDF
MAGHKRHVSVRHCIVMLLMILTANASAKHGFLHPKRADTCSKSSQKCSGAGLPDNFCCSSGSTCIGIDNGSSVICCPDGQDCTYIQPITCDVTKQDVSLHPDNVIKTTRLGDDLPACGKACCPFGYTCQGSFCAMDEPAASTPTSASTQSTTTSTFTSSSESSEATESSTMSTTDSSETFIESSESASSTSTADETDSPLSIADDLSTVTVTESSTSSSPTATSSQFSVADNNLSSCESPCPAFPTNAVLAGFFPGAVFGAVAALLVIVCIRRRQRNNIPAGEKVAQNTFRNSTGTLIGISDPIPSDESSFRTDFLLTKRHSDSRSVLSRSRSRVKSLFSTTPKLNPTPAPAPAADIPAVPPVPAVFGLPETPRPQRQRQPSSESIRIYTPPGVFVNPGPSPYSEAQRPNTTLTEILDQAQARIDAESVSGSGANSKTNSTATAMGAAASGNTTQRFLLPPPQKLGGGRRKQLPY